MFVCLNKLDKDVDSVKTKIKTYNEICCISAAEVSLTNTRTVLTILTHKQDLRMKKVTLKNNSNLHLSARYNKLHRVLPISSNRCVSHD